MNFKTFLKFSKIH